MHGTFEKTVGQTAQLLLESADASISPQQVLTVFINELTDARLDAWLVVLEDYHFIANPVIHQLVDLLLENGPANLHLIISTRADPPLALARLRARGMLAELRAPDLRFREDEISALLARDIPDLSEQSLLLLSEKTEGWAAALQIVRSSLNGHDARSAGRLIASLNGSHRYIFEYLAGEVFRRQSAERQTFLLHTAILVQMEAAVCNALPGITDAQSMLDQLEQENLFLTSLDVQRRWYRYHHLFREFLLSKLQREQPQQAMAVGNCGRGILRAPGRVGSSLCALRRSASMGSSGAGDQDFRSGLCRTRPGGGLAPRPDQPAAGNLASRTGAAAPAWKCPPPPGECRTGDQCL